MRFKGYCLFLRTLLLVAGFLCYEPRPFGRIKGTKFESFSWNHHSDFWWKSGQNPSALFSGSLFLSANSMPPMTGMEAANVPEGSWDFATTNDWACSPTSDWVHVHRLSEEDSE